MLRKFVGLVTKNLQSGGGHNFDFRIILELCVQNS